MRKLISKIVKKINIACIILLLLSCLSVFIHPNLFWPLQFLGTAYPLLFFINLAFVAFWLIKKRTYYIYSLIAVIIGLFFITRFIQFTFLSKKDMDNKASQAVTIISYNVRLFNLYKWVKTDSVTNKFIDFINNESPGIVCLQEFYTGKNGITSEKSLSKAIGDIFFSHISYTVRKPNISNFGIATFSRYPIVHRGEIVFGNSFNQCIYTDVLVNTDTIRIYNAHLQSYRFLKQDYATIDSLKFKYSQHQMAGLKGIYYRLKSTYQKRAFQADTLAAHMKKSPYPVIVCGDFNDSPVSYTYQRISKGMTDAFMESGSGIGSTYFGKFPSYRIDYILHDNTFKAFGYRSPNVNISDHFPVICEISRKTIN